MERQNQIIEGFLQISRYSDASILATLFIVELFVFIKLKLNIDRPGIITLILHLIVSLLRAIRDFVFNEPLALIAVSNTLIWFSLHYFTFQMWFIKITLTSDNFEMRQKKLNRAKLIEIIDRIYIFSFMTVTGVSTFLTIDQESQFYLENTRIVFTSALSLAVTFALVNSVMLIVFLRLFIFFFSYRKKLLLSRISGNVSQTAEYLTAFNKFIIVLVFFLCFLQLVVIASSMADATNKLVNGTDFDKSAIHVFYLTPMYVLVFPLKDLIVALGFAYLYYHQAMKKKRAEREGDDESHPFRQDQKPLSINNLSINTDERITK